MAYQRLNYFAHNLLLAAGQQTFHDLQQRVVTNLMKFTQYTFPRRTQGGVCASLAENHAMDRTSLEDS